MLGQGEKLRDRKKLCGRMSLEICGKEDLAEECPSETITVTITITARNKAKGKGAIYDMRTQYSLLM